MIMMLIAFIIHYIDIDDHLLSGTRPVKEAKQITKRIALF